MLERLQMIKMVPDPVVSVIDGLIEILSLFEARDLAPELRKGRFAKEQELQTAIERDKRGGGEGTGSI